MATSFECGDCGRTLTTERQPGDVVGCSCGAPLVVPDPAAHRSTICRVCGTRGTTDRCDVCGSPTRPAQLEDGGPRPTAQRATAGAGPSPSSRRARRQGAQGKDSRQARKDQARARDSLRVGRVVGRALSLFGRRLLVIAGIALGIYLPVLVFTQWCVLTAAPGYEPFPAEGATPESLVQALLGIVCSQVVTASLIDAVLQWLRGQPSDVGRSLGHGLRAAPRVFGVSFMVGLIALVFVGVPILILGAISSTLGLIAFLPGIVFGLWIAAKYWLATVVTVVEGSGVTASLRRSGELTEGLRGRVALILIVVGLVNWLFMMVLVPLMIPVPAEWIDLILQGMSAIIMGFGAVAQTIAYHDLRQAREGLDTDELAAIFE